MGSLLRTSRKGQKRALLIERVLLWGYSLGCSLPERFLTKSGLPNELPPFYTSEEIPGYSLFYRGFGSFSAPFLTGFARFCAPFPLPSGHSLGLYPRVLTFQLESAEREDLHFRTGKESSCDSVCPCVTPLSVAGFPAILAWFCCAPWFILGVFCLPPTPRF